MTPSNADLRQYTRIDEVTELVTRARCAQKDFEQYTQEQVDEVVTAAGWAVVEPENNLRLARMTVKDTGLGNVEDKVDKNWRKTLGLLRDLQGIPSVGVIGRNPEKGMTEIARPVGVVASVIPSTSPVAATANMVLNALKGRNAIIVSASPSAQKACSLLCELINRELERVGAPVDLVQCLRGVNKESTFDLMKQVDFIAVSGSPSNIKAAHGSGTPTLSFGAGNVPVLVDASADIAHAATSIARSKTYDNATGCSSENSLVVEDRVYVAMLSALEDSGGMLLTEQEKTRLQSVMWVEGKLNRKIIARSASEICELAGIECRGNSAVKFLMVEEEGIGKDHPFSDEKLSPVLTIYRAPDWDGVIDITRHLLNFKGAGHSIGVYSETPNHALRAALELPTARVIVNQPNILATGGGFNNWMPFSLSIACGSWGRNATTDNLTYRDFLNITRISEPVQREAPTEDAIFGAYWAKHGLDAENADEQRLIMGEM